jgi:hypothetical protein
MCRCECERELTAEELPIGCDCPPWHPDTVRSDSAAGDHRQQEVSMALVEGPRYTLVGFMPPITPEMERSLKGVRISRVTANAIRLPKVQKP